MFINVSTSQLIFIRSDCWFLTSVSRLTSPVRGSVGETGRPLRTRVKGQKKVENITAVLFTSFRRETIQCKNAKGTNLTYTVCKK